MSKLLRNGRDGTDPTVDPPTVREFLSVVHAEDRRIVLTVDGWADLIRVLPGLPDAVYEIQRPGAGQVAAATSDGHGGWHIWSGG